MLQAAHYARGQGGHLLAKADAGAVDQELHVRRLAVCCADAVLDVVARGQGCGAAGNPTAKEKGSVSSE